jgi:hypothetical protein
MNWLRLLPIMSPVIENGEPEIVLSSPLELALYALIGPDDP